ncbi:ABC transporter ATP-binding protein [Vibrio sp. MA40-2]|uniref:ABC transporter ATP-binding protein n=1 Tax=Vibrio sp. MA40-2 TaxID=3391828 RepID=UPI0039A5C73B
MDKLRFLLKHSGASHRDFRIGVAGKIVNEMLPLSCWFLLFVYIAYGWHINLIYALSLSVAVLCGQWLFGQSARQSFLGAYEITHNLRKVLLKDIRSQPMSLITGRGLGERISLITKDLKSFEDIFSHLLADLAASCVVPVAMVVVLFSVSTALGALMLGLIVLAWIILQVCERSFSRQANKYHATRSDVANKTLEYIECLPTLKQFGQSNKLADPLCNQIEQLRTRGLGVEWAGGTGVILSTLLLELSIPLIAYIGTLQVNSGTLSQNEWVIVVIACVACTRPFVRMTIFSTLIRYMFKSAHRLHALAITQQQPREGCRPRDHSIQLQGVTFSFENQPVLHNVNLDIKPGEHIAITGPSGAGKSTLLDLIAAFYIPSEGTVKIGGESLSMIGTHHWYQHISYVTQNVQLFAGTLRENLLIAHKYTSEAKLMDAVRLAGIDDLIARLPEGLESDVGENGNHLSGGERQRLSIARALLHDAPIVLLDEFTSALDAEKQLEILKGLESFFTGKTLITIAHRLDTIANADRIYFFDKGKVVDEGTHDLLMMRCKQYQQLWMIQTSHKPQL